MVDWLSVLFQYHFYINNPSFSHLEFHSLLANDILFRHMRFHINHLSLELAPIKQFVPSKNKPHSEITKFLCFFFTNSKN